MSETVLLAVIAAIVSTVATLSTLIISLNTRAKVQETHLLINSNLEQWKLSVEREAATAIRAALAEGTALGLATGRNEGHAEGLIQGAATALAQERAPLPPP